MRLPSTAALAARHAALRRACAAAGVDAIVVLAPANVRYLTNHGGSAGTLVLTATSAHLLLDGRYETAMQGVQASPAACPGLRIWPVPGGYDEALIGCLADLRLPHVGFERVHLTVARHEWLLARASSAAPGVVLRGVGPLVEQARMVKDAEEIALLRRGAAGIAGVASAAFRAIAPGVRESEVAAVIEGALRAGGYERPAFDTIVASGPNGALPHHRAGERRLEDGDLVVLDFGGVMDGYCCDLTRTVAVGTPSPEARQLHAAVLAAHQSAIAAVRPGVETTAVDTAARAVLEAANLGEAFTHGTGHGLGLEVHEEPRIGRRRPDVPTVTLEPGMVFTIEPGAYVPGWAGVRIEDDVLVTADGCEVLTDVPLDWRAA